jgi:hypothetical protein
MKTIMQRLRKLPVRQAVMALAAVMLSGIVTSGAADGAVPPPALTVPSLETTGAGLATLLLQSDSNGTGYFTLLSGSGATCGSGDQVKAGRTGTDTPAPYRGSLPLTAATTGKYTVRNLTQSTPYTVCFTADAPAGGTLQPTPTTADFTTSAIAVNANPGWGVVGNAGFSAGQADNTSLVLAPDGTPYVAYSDGLSGNKATVMKFDGSNWITVGSAGFSSTGGAYAISLAFAPDGTPHVAYMDGGNSTKATVMKYSGSSWVTVGSAGFSGGRADWTSLAFAPDGTPFVAYQDETSNFKTTVMRYDGNDWVSVGSAGFSAGVADYQSFAVAPDGIPYVAYRDFENSFKATLMKFDGSKWAPVGNAGFSAGEAMHISLVLAPNGTPFVAYTDFENSLKSSVMKYDGNNWGNVGIAGLSTGAATFNSLAMAPDGSLYVAYVDYDCGPRATVMKYDGSWQVVGRAGFSIGGVAYNSLRLAGDGTPFLAFQDVENGSKATVMAFAATATVTAGAGPNGSISPAGATTLSAGTSQTYTITPDTGYAVEALAVDGTVLPGATSYTFSNVTEDHYINAYFAPAGFTITAGAGPNGSISPYGATTLSAGTSQTYTITPDPGYVVEALAVDGTILPGATSYTFTNVTADHYINAYFAPAGFTITAGAGPNGSISPSGATTLSAGTSQSYTITADPGYTVIALVVDGTHLPGAASYTFTSVTADHYINAYFAPTGFTITAGAGPNGSISPAGVTTLSAGTGKSYTITPDPGYAVIALVVDGTLLPGAASYTFTNVTADHYINAYFEQVFAITAGAGPNGSISPSGATTLSVGTSKSYTITPDPGYAVIALVVDGTLLPGAAAHTFTNITADHYINAYFAPAVTINTFPEGLGITVDGTLYTAPRTFAWTPGSSHTIATAATQAEAGGTRYVFASWSDAGAISHQIVAPSAPAVYSAAFTTQYQITVAVSPPGTGDVSPASGSWLSAGAVVPVKVFPLVGYGFVSWNGPVADSASAATAVTMSGPLTITANTTGIPVLTAVISAKSGTSPRLWQIKVSNSGQIVAHGVQVSGLTLTQTFGETCTPLVTPSQFPVSLGDIDVGGSATGTVQIDFTSCAATARFTATIGYSADGGAIVGSSSYANQFR